MSTKLAVPVSAKTIKTAKQQIEAANQVGADIIELRVDYLENLDITAVKNLIAAVKNSGNSSVLVTCRDDREGGTGHHSIDLRMNVFAEAVQSGVDFIDLEFQNYKQQNIRRKIKPLLDSNPKTRLILSAHDFERKFQNISDLYTETKNCEPDAVPKLVYTANHINDCFEVFDLLHNSKDDVITFCMGEAGLISRVLAVKLGGFLTFASLNIKSATAPGQLTATELKELYRFDSINDKIELFGVIGSPVAHSASPAVFNTCFEKEKMNRLYLPLLVEDGQREFDIFLNNILKRTWLNFKGFSVTIPHKHNALDYAKNRGGFVEPLAERIGAANTIVINENGKINLYNTDCAGAMEAITENMKIERKDLRNVPVAVVGAGGVARAVVVGLTDVGAGVKIYNRTVQKAERLAKEFDCECAGLDDLPNLNAKLLINCTSLGMYPDIKCTPVLKEYLSSDMVVFDTVYNPAQTLLLKEAKKIGAKTIDGLSMFVNQAAAQFKLFTNKVPDRALMRKVVSQKLSQP